MPTMFWTRGGETREGSMMGERRARNSSYDDPTSSRDFRP